MPVDKILEEFVQRVTNVQIAVGVGRTVVQYKSFGVTSLGIRGEFGVQIGRGPVALKFRFANGGIGALIEGRLGQEDGFGVNVFGGLFFPAAGAEGGEGTSGATEGGRLKGGGEFVFECEEEEGHEDLFHLRC